FKQKTAYEIGLGIPAEPLFRSFFCVSKNVSVSCAYTQGKREQFSGFNRTLDAINNVFRKFSAFHDETGRLNVDGMNIISNDGSNKLNRSRKARVSYKVQRTINATSTQRRARERSVAIQTLLLVRKSKSSSVKSKTAEARMSLIEAKAVWKRTDCSVTRLMISYLFVVEQHRTQIVIHALLKCQQENLYHEQNVTHILTSPRRTCQAY